MANIDAVVQAARKNAVHTLQELLKAGADVNDHSKYGATPLTEAATHGRTAAIECLLEAGAVVNEPDYQAWSALHLAVRGSHKRAAETLLAAGADVNAVQHGGNGWTPLLCAIDKMQPEIVQLLLKNGARPQHILGAAGENALHLAVRRFAHKNAEEVVKALLAGGAPTENRSTKEGETPLEVAVQLGATPMMQVLVEGGADPNAESEEKGTVLHVAVRTGKTEPVQTLITLGADVNKATAVGQETPLHAAVQSAAIVKILLEKGVEVDAKDCDGRTAFLRCVSTASKEQVEILRILAAAGADVNAADNRKHGGLHYAAIAADIQRHQADTLVKLLVELGVEGNGEDSECCTPLITASKNGNWAVAEALLNVGVDAAPLDNKGFSALLYAASQTVPPWIIRSMIEKGSDVIQADNLGNRALHLAVSAAKKEVVDALLDNGAEADERNGDGETALMLCAKQPLAGTTIGRALLLKKNEASISPRSKDGWTAMTLAALNLQPDLLGLLVKRCTTDDAVSLLSNTDSASTCVHLAAMAVVDAAMTADAQKTSWCKEKLAVKVMKLAVDAGQAVDAQDKKGRTALKIALDGIDTAVANNNRTKMEQCTVVGKWLVKNGADLDATECSESSRDMILENNVSK